MTYELCGEVKLSLTSLPKGISKEKLLQLQIQALQVTECAYKNSSNKFIMAKPVKCLCTLIFQYDIHKNALKNQYN